MGQRSIVNSPALAKAIRARRIELGLTIEEAAVKADVGTKTWCRYEAGESIRRDKYKGICRALQWRALPGEEDAGDDDWDLEDYKKHEAWSEYLANTFGSTAAISFVIGSDILLDNLQEDMEALSALPRGAHVGQISISWLKALLPPQFLMQYDYDFLYTLRATVVRLRMYAQAGRQIIAHSVMEELALYLITEQSQYLIETSAMEPDDNWKDWIFTIFGDNDLVFCLYSDGYLDPDHIYHFDHWMDKQFYCSE